MLVMKALFWLRAGLDNIGQGCDLRRTT